MTFPLLELHSPSRNPTEMPHWAYSSPITEHHCLLIPVQSLSATAFLQLPAPTLPAPCPVWESVCPLLSAMTISMLCCGFYSIAYLSSRIQMLDSYNVSIFQSPLPSPQPTHHTHTHHQMRPPSPSSQTIHHTPSDENTMS